MQHASCLDSQSFRPPVEQFTWARWTWDVARIRRDIDDGRLRPTWAELSRAFVHSYARGVLGLRSAAGRGQQSMSVLVRIDVKAALGLPLAALDEPLLMVAPPRGKGMLHLGGDVGLDHVLADGVHRLARAFVEDRAPLRCHVLSYAQSRRYLVG